MAIKSLSKIIRVLFLVVYLQTSISGAARVSAQDDAPLPEYIVQSGETLSAIAIRFGVSIDEILAVNELVNPNSIAAGSRLRIPGLEGVEGTLVTETVPFGDTLTSLSLSRQFPIPLMVKLNRISSPSEIYAGSELIVPQPEDDSTFTPQTAVLDDESLLETAIRNSANPWSYQLSNNLAGSWDVSKSQVLYGPQSETSKFSPISPLLEGIAIAPLPFVQGKTTEILVKTRQEMTLTGSLGDYDLPFYQLSSGAYVSLMGIPALIDPGLYPVSLTGETADGQTFEYTQQVLLTSGGYTNEYVEGVDASTIEAGSIQAEDDILVTVQGTEASALWTEPLQYPVDEPCLASRFGVRRSYNQGQYDFYHTGQDFVVCADNLNIYAPAPGIVKFVGTLPIKGNFTLIDHGLGVYTGYAHQSEILVSEGDRVNTGDQIGVIGNTGRSVGPHLHWEVWVNHIPVDPLEWVEKVYPIPDLSQ